MPADSDRVLRLFREHGGVLRTSEALARGVRSHELSRLHEEGRLERLSRGVFRLVEGPELAAPDLVALAKRAPRAVVCLVSALHFHGMTLEVPHDAGPFRPGDVATCDSFPGRSWRIIAPAGGSLQIRGVLPVEEVID